MLTRQGSTNSAVGSPRLYASEVGYVAIDEDGDELLGVNGNGSPGLLEEWSWKRELWPFFNLAWPVILTCLLELSPGVISVILVGRYCEKDELDAAALGTMYSNILGLSLGLGIATALDTLSSQAYGAAQPKMLGVYLQRSVLILGALYVPVFIVNYLTDDILKALGQPTHVSDLSGEFVRLLLPGMPLLWLYEVARKTFQAMGIVRPMMWIAVISNLMIVGLTYFFLAHTDIGYNGAALARSIGNGAMPLMLLVYVKYTGVQKEFWPGWSRQAWQGWGEFLRLGIPGMLALCLEWWAFEILAVLCGLTKDPETAIGANAVLLNTSTMTYMIYLGISVAATVRVGLAVGAGHAEKARIATKVGLGAELATSAAAAILFLGLRQNLGPIFVKDKAIIDAVTGASVLLALYQVVDAINIGCAGVFKGAGLQFKSAVIYFCAYYLFGLPLGIFLTFGTSTGLSQLETLWLGLVGGLCMASLASLSIVARWDWDALVGEVEEDVYVYSELNEDLG